MTSSKEQLDFGRRELEVQGMRILYDVNAEARIGPDLDQEMDRVSAQLAWWGSVAASAAKEAADADSYYRQWRAQRTKDLLQADPKIAEWKVKAEIEASEAFLELKYGVALANENAQLAVAMVQALKEKANLLPSKGARARAELEASGMTTPAKPTAARTPRAPTGSEDGEDGGEERGQKLVSNMKTIFGKGAAKAKKENG